MEDQVDKDKEDKEEENEILEESPCKRWSKRCEKVKQRDVPGIDAAYLAMDNETGNEVVWNEVLFSERKNLRDQEERIRSVFDNLTRLEHPNLVKFHKYWIDTKSDKPRIIFITEYMSSGSISRFLQRARSSGTLLSIKAWKNWNRQILSALSYLHSCDPPIVHANLSCNTIFIQQNGLVKIGCVAPKTIHHHVKTFRENIKNIHYLAPEYDHLTEPTTQADIYSFGVCALEMATTGALQSGHLNGGSSGACTSDKNSTTNATGQSGDGGPTVVAAGGGGGGFHIVTEEMLRKALDTLEDPEQKEFIERSMEHDPAKRANVAELLSRLGPAEPEKHDETSLDEDGFIEMERQQQRRTSPPHEQSPADRATSPQETAPNIDAAAPMANSAETSLLPSMQQNMPTEPSSFPAPASNGTAATTIPSQQPAQNNVAHHNLSSQQNGYYNTQCAATTTISTHACATASTTATAVSATTLLSTQSQTNTNCTTSSGAGTAAGITSSSTSTNTTSSATALLSTASSAPQSQVQLQQNSMAAASAPDEGYHTTQSMVDHHTTTGTSTPLSAELAAAAAAANSMSSLQYRETRQILEMHAEVLDGQQLRVQLQLDDQMHRQLTGPLRAEDTAETLAAELVQHGFVSEANSKGIFDLLTNLLAEHRRKELELATRREFGESGGQNSQQQQHSGSNSNPSSAHQSPKHHPATGGGNGGKALDTTTLPNNIASDQKTTANAVTTTASAVAPNGAATPRPP